MSKDENIQDNLNKSLGIKCTSHDIYNELLEIIAHHLLRGKSEAVRGNVFFCMMGDEYTDITLLAVCGRKLGSSRRLF